MRSGIRAGACAIAAITLAAPAVAQFSVSYNFLKAVRDADGEKVTKLVSEPGTTVINTRDDKGEGALAIVVKRRDLTWLSFLLGKGANPDIRDGDGNTPLILATQIGFTEGANLLVRIGANVNLGNTRGETPLIFAVHNRDLPTMRVLLAAGANPKQADRIAGKSARDYAVDDPRAGAMVKMLDELATKPKATISGPRL